MSERRHLVGTIPSGGSRISDHFLVNLAKTTDNNSLSGTGTTTVSTPEPASVGLMLAGAAVAGLALPRLRRKARA